MPCAASLLAILVVTTFGAASPLVPYIPAGPNGTVQTLFGIPADRLCVEERNALDGADMLLEPTEHTIHCMVDIQRCIDSGYCLLQPAMNPAAGNRTEFHCAYNFSTQATAALVRWLEPRNKNGCCKRNKMQRMNITGRWDATGTFVIDEASLVWSGAVATPSSIAFFSLTVLLLASLL